MAKRVSLKGRGADIFFGDFAAEPEAATTAQASTDLSRDGALAESLPSPEELAEAQDVNLASKQASSTAKQRRRVQASESAHQVTAQEQAGEALLPTAAILEAIGDELLAPATITNSFRYTEAELEALNDAIYLVTRQHRVRLSKQEVARLGLNLILWDYRVHGDTSLLAVLAQRRSRKRPER